ncbi:hypothetical protein [Hymenobacter negativus]|uniref:Uncharacterized protein n=1 Tax=Hymenobacter negativus TaxID=2795026 RepID=A0ABS0Q3Z3_9BACT|nr:hypothetical protein [Hymenobacter negativus]MBH8557282.1 hypothetical protein [Hymenobacter negativus]
MTIDETISFYRIELNGKQIPVSFEEIHELRKDILPYFDENIGENISVLLPTGQFNRPYWKFLSIDFEQEWAESIRYKKVVEEGCLALLNGIALELLDQPITDLPTSWQETEISTILSYINHYNPSSERLNIAKNHLIRTYNFLLQFSYNDIDEDRMLIDFNPADTGRWFDEEIVKAYYKWQIKIYAS